MIPLVGEQILISCLVAWSLDTVNLVTFDLKESLAYYISSLYSSFTNPSSSLSLIVFCYREVFSSWRTYSWLPVLETLVFKLRRLLFFSSKLYCNPIIFVSVAVAFAFSFSNDFIAWSSCSCNSFYSRLSSLFYVWYSSNTSLRLFLCLVLRPVISPLTWSNKFLVTMLRAFVILVFKACKGSANILREYS